MALPKFNDDGDLPLGLHRASIDDVLLRFGGGTNHRRIAAYRLQRVYEVAISTRHVERFIVFGSFITDAPEPNDVDVFLLMDNEVDAAQLSKEAGLLFDHSSAQDHFGASVFWLRKLAALEGEERTLEYWQVKRGGGRRGIVEIVPEIS